MKLISEGRWKIDKDRICASLGHLESGNEAMADLTKELDAAYMKVASNFQYNDSVRLDLSGKHPSLTVSKLDGLAEPDSLRALREATNGLLPKVDLTELLLEIHGHTSFAGSFSHVSESGSRAKDLTISICAVLIAEACNIGLEPLVEENVPALTQHRLSWVKQNFLHKETLTMANTRLIDHQSTLSLVNKSGAV